MKKITWVNFVHLYQPPWQKPEMIHRVANESYQFLVDALKKNPYRHFTMNIAGSLLEHLDMIGYTRLLRDINMLVKRGQIELTLSSYHHAFLPQLPDSEIVRQLKLHRLAVKRYFPSAKIKGCFLPELAYTPRVGHIVKKLGISWIILDPICTRTKTTSTFRYQDRTTHMTIVFCDRLLSKSYPPERIFKLLPPKKNKTIITATDGELYGHFHQDWQDHLKQVFASPHVDTLTISDYLNGLTTIRPVSIRNASWATKEKDMQKHDPFPLWYGKYNDLHHAMWNFATLTIRTVADHAHDQNFQWARYHLDRGLSSCSWWWASHIKTSPFAPMSWNPDEIENGMTELIKAHRSLTSLSANKKISAEKKFHAIILNVWQTHWKRYGH